MGCFLMKSLLNLIMTEEVFHNIVTSADVWSKFELFQIDQTLGLDKFQVLRRVEVLLIWSLREVKFVIWSVILIVVVLRNIVVKSALLV